MTRQMPAGAQIAFTKSWLERQGIEAQTIDVEAHIDPSLSYEENIKLMKREFKLGGGRSRQKATRDLSAAECDVAIGNYHAGYNHGSMTDACACGHPDACVDLERAGREATAKPKAKPKAVATPKFKTTEDAEQWLEKKYVEYGGRWKFQATSEYKKVHPHLLDLWGKKNRQIEKERKQINIVKNPHGTGYVIQFGTRTNVYAGGGGMMGGMATFETVDKAVKEAKRSGYEIMSKPKPKASAPKRKPTRLPAIPDVLTTSTAKMHDDLTAAISGGFSAKPTKGLVSQKEHDMGKTLLTWGKGDHTPAPAPKPKPKAAPKRKPTAKPKKAAPAGIALTATQKKRLAAKGSITVKRNGKFITITK